FVRLRALFLEPSLQLHDRDDRHRTELLAQLDRRAGVVRMPVCDGDHVTTVRILLRVRTLWVVEPRIDVDTLSTRCVEAEGGVPEPGQRRVSHRAPFVLVEVAERKGTSDYGAKLGRDGPPSASGPARADRPHRRPL